MKDESRPYISVRGLYKSFNGNPVLQGVDFDVHQGETLVVLGGSGEGKSVILRHLKRPGRARSRRGPDRRALAQWVG